MVRKFTSIAFASALVLVTAPAFAQDLGGAINGLTAAPGQLIGGMGQGLGIDLDPFHIFTPAPTPAMAPEPMMMHKRHHMMMHKHKMMMHKKMMMHHKGKMMMHKKMMMKKPMMKKDDMKKDDMSK